MSELKAYLCIQAREIEIKTFSCYNQTLAVKYAPEVTMAQVYLKSEADKVIAHNKRKRCLNEAKICQLRLERYERYLDEFNCNSSTIDRWRFLKRLYEKWHKCWLELAEKFKEAK